MRFVHKQMIDVAIHSLTGCNNEKVERLDYNNQKEWKIM